MAQTTFAGLQINAFAIVLFSCLLSGASPIELDLQRRDPQSGEIRTETKSFEAENLGVMLVDTWNWHWCMTATQRCVSFVPRFNRALQGLRKLGVQVFWGPTDVADQYVGWPQRQNALAAKHIQPPKIDITFPELHCFQGGSCMCGPGINCAGNFGWSGMAPTLEIEPQDLITEGTEEFYSLCHERGISTLLFFGFHTNVCTSGKPVGLGPMMRTGMEAILCRDMTDAISGYAPDQGEHPDKGTREVIEQLETGLPTVHIVSVLQKQGLWDKVWIVDPVRLNPWGTIPRPYFFEESVTVTLSAPLNEGAELFYTLDGSEPTASATRYTAPIRLTETVTLRAIGLIDSNPVCLASEGRYVKLPLKPPQPDIYLSEIQPIYDSVNARNPYVSKKKPKYDTNYYGKEISLRGVKFEKGAGVEVPALMQYAVKPEYERFVGLAGVDETIHDDDYGQARAMYPSVVFKIFIDDRMVSESPMMRFGQEPWRFDVPIPREARTISVISADGGDGNRYDFANWANAGFMVRK